MDKVEGENEVHSCSSWWSTTNDLLPLITAEWLSKDLTDLVVGSSRARVSYKTS